MPIETKISMAGNLADVITCGKFEHDIFRGTILQGVEFPIFLLIYWALQQCSATAHPVIREIVCYGVLSKRRRFIKNTTDFRKKFKEKLMAAVKFLTYIV